MYVTAQINFICSGAGSSDAHVQFSCAQERSGRASEHGIQRSEVPFPKGTEDFFFVPYRGQKLSFFNSGEHRRCHQVWSNTFESKGMKFLLIELNEPIN